MEQKITNDMKRPSEVTKEPIPKGEALEVEHAKIISYDSYCKRATFCGEKPMSEMAFRACVNALREAEKELALARDVVFKWQDRLFIS